MFWIKIASPAYQGKGSYKLLLQFLRHTEKGFLFWLLKIPRLYLINIRPLWRSSDNIKCCSDGQRSGKTCRRRIIKWGQKKRMCNGLRRVEKVRMILIKSKANDVNNDILRHSDDFDHLAVGVLCKFKAPWQKKVRDELDWIWMLGIIRNINIKSHNWDELLF